MIPPKVSVILPAYNAEKYLEKSIRSLMAQSFDDIEFIIIDDCSTDSTLSVIKSIVLEYPQRSSKVKIFSQPYNQGVATARALGISNSLGEYTIQIDSDDYCEPDMIECLYSHAIQHNADMVICDYYVNYPKKQNYISQKAPSTGKECMSALMRGKLHGSTSNKLIKRTLYTNNSINFTPGLNMWEDLSTVVKLSFYANKIAYLPAAFLHYVQINPSSYTIKVSISSLNNIKQAIEDIELFIKKNNVESMFKEDLIFLKLNAKSEWLKHTRGTDQRISAQLYPETNAYILKNRTNPIHYRYAQWFASKKCFFVADMILFIVKFGKFLIRK